MAGRTTLVNYISDLGDAYRTRVPLWQVAVTGDADATDAPTFPRGWGRRYRLIRDETDKTEHKVHVGDVTLYAWTAPIGATVPGISEIPGHTGTTFTFQGARGERRSRVT